MVSAISATVYFRRPVGARLVIHAAGHPGLPGCQLGFAAAGPAAGPGGFQAFAGAFGDEAGELARGEVSRDAELLVLRHENAILRCQAGRVRYQPGDRLWLAALSRLIPRRRWSEVFAVTRRRCSPGTGG